MKYNKKILIQITSFDLEIHLKDIQISRWYMVGLNSSMEAMMEVHKLFSR